MSTKVSDEMLMAFVDGELEPETAAEIEQAVAQDAVLGRRAEAFRASRGAAREAFAGLRRDTVPPRLIEAVMKDGSHANTSFVRRPDFIRAALPLAASLALIAGIGGYMLGQAGVPEHSDLLGGAALAEAVGATLSGEVRTLRSGGREVAVRGLATYPIEDGVCRMFEAAPVQSEPIRGIACRFAEQWHLEVAVAVPANDGLTPAAEGAAEVLDAYLDRRGAGPALTRDEEREALRE